MIRWFLDASVLFSAAYSDTGAAHEIIQLGFAGQLELVVSDLVLEEARRNLAAKAPAALPAFETFVVSAPFVVTDPNYDHVVKMAKFTALKDAPVVAAAMRGRVSCLVSHDVKHLVGNRVLERAADMRILTPGDALQLLRGQVKKGGEHA